MTTYISLGLGLILLSGSLHHLAAYRRPGIFPPKKLLKQRAVTLGCTAIFFLAISTLLIIITK